MTRYEKVWSETSRLYNEMMQSGDWSNVESNAKSSIIHIPVMQEVTTRIALSVILSVSFGQPLSWKDTSPTRPQSTGKGIDAGQMRLSDGVKYQADNVILVSNAPFLLNLPIERWVIFWRHKHAGAVRSFPLSRF